MLLQRLSMLYIPDFFSQLLYGPCESAQSVAGHSETATRACSCGFVAKPWILQHLILNEVVCLLAHESTCGVNCVDGSECVGYLYVGVPFYGLNRQKNYPEPKSQHVEVLRFMTGQVARSNRIDGSFCTVFLLCHESKHS